jgi:uncharacterized DUF497 family protein
MHNCAYNIMEYQWDSRKAEINRKKHGIRFADAVSIFSDERMIMMEDIDPEEQRFVAIGTDAFGRILVVVYSWRYDNIRIVSARRATRRERRQYEGAS